MTISADEVLTERRGRAGVITLNRPKALNALTHSMVTAMAAALQSWREDPEVDVVVLLGAGERALCAGGDIVSLYHDALAGGTQGGEFWADEYTLNLAISRYPKPYVAVMHGIVLGGGIGVSAHGSHRVVTDGTTVGMPETGIGFVPDVGGSWLLGNHPGHLGRHLALTGKHVGPAEAIDSGLADVYVPRDRLDDAVAEVCRTGDPEVLRQASQLPPADPAVPGGVVEQVYRHETVPQILEALDALASPGATEVADWARDAATRIRRNSPLALAVTLASLKRARGRTLAQVLDTEWRVSVNMQARPDFAEGVRAQLVDRDRSPRWSPATLDDVTTEAVDALFAPVTDPRYTPLRLAP